MKIDLESFELDMVSELPTFQKTKKSKPTEVYNKKDNKRYRKSNFIKREEVSFAD